MLLKIDISKLTIIIGWVLFAFLVFIILYRILLAKLKQGRLEKELYFVLHPLATETANGVIQIYVELHQPMEIEISILSTDIQVQKILEKKTFKKGGNVIEFDTCTLENGFYFYQAVSENQKTRKRIEIRN